jgi:hypothetical protein
MNCLHAVHTENDTNLVMHVVMYYAVQRVPHPNPAATRLASAPPSVLA